jgi:hypothetical protein
VYRRDSVGGQTRSYVHFEIAHWKVQARKGERQADDSGRTAVAHYRDFVISLRVSISTEAAG